jgi:hypothetical protein
VSQQIKSKQLKVISICSVCGKPVCATSKDKAYRHGFNRYVIKNPGYKQTSQEDGSPCSGSGQPVVYRRRILK